MESDLGLAPYSSVLPPAGEVIVLPQPGSRERADLIDWLAQILHGEAQGALAPGERVAWPHVTEQARVTARGGVETMLCMLAWRQRMSR